MYQLVVTYNDVVAAMEKHETHVDKEIVKKAYEYAESKHEGQVRKTGEAYITHPLRVAKSVAEWGFDQEVVAAALLHDVIEDCCVTEEELEREFGANITVVVSTLTDVNEQLYQKQGMKKEQIDDFSSVHFMATINKKALFIKVADRIDNLQTISIMPEVKQFKKSQHTREILIPLVGKQGAFRLVDILEELCFQLEHKQRYLQISNLYQSLRNDNEVDTQKAVEKFKGIFVKAKEAAAQYGAVYEHDIRSFVYEPRSNISIFREVTKETSNLKREIEQFMQKGNIAQFDLTLILRGRETSQLELYFWLYEKFLKEAGFSIFCTKKTTHKDSKYLLIGDDKNNLYRLFIRTEDSFKRYCLGNMGDIDDNLKPVSIDEISPRDSYNRKIKVYKRNGDACYIDDGATVLDLAFLIHSQIGMHFAYALIDESKTQMPAFTRLNEGDMITIKTSSEITAKINWFNYSKTSKATHHLVKYFSDKYEKK